MHVLNVGGLWSHLPWKLAAGEETEKKWGNEQFITVVYCVIPTPSVSTGLADESIS